RLNPATPHDTGRTAVAERFADQSHRIVQPALQSNPCCTGVRRCERRHAVHHDVLGEWIVRRGSCRREPLVEDLIRRIGLTLKGLWGLAAPHHPVVFCTRLPCPARHTPCAPARSHPENVPLYTRYCSCLPGIPLGHACPSAPCEELRIR